MNICWWLAVNIWLHQVPVTILGTSVYHLKSRIWYELIAEGERMWGWRFLTWVMGWQWCLPLTEILIPGEAISCKERMKEEGQGRQFTAHIVILRANWYIQMKITKTVGSGVYQRAHWKCVYNFKKAEIYPHSIIKAISHIHKSST